MYLSKASNSWLPGRGLINPAFVIKIVPATDDLQQKPQNGRPNPNDNFLDNLQIGDSVEADLGKTRLRGRVSRIVKNSNGDAVYVVVKDRKGKKHKVDSSRIKLSGSTDPGDENQERLVSSPAVFAESKFLSFKEFSRL
jgi:hypothetical protein